MKWIDMTEEWHHGDEDADERLLFSSDAEHEFEIITDYMDPDNCEISLRIYHKNKMFLEHPMNPDNKQHRFIKLGPFYSEKEAKVCAEKYSAQSFRFF